MQKSLLISIVYLFFSFNTIGQVTDTGTNKSFDSTEVMKDLMALLDGTKTSSSYFLAEVSFGNRVFNQHVVADIVQVTAEF